MNTSATRQTQTRRDAKASDGAPWPFTTPRPERFSRERVLRLANVTVVRGVLDNEKLDGPNSCALRLRPPRTARIVKGGDYQRFRETVELTCQIWGGAAHPLLPIDDELRISRLYRDRIVGADVDHLEGLPFGGAVSDPLEYGDQPVVRMGEEFAAVAWRRPTTDGLPAIVVPTLDPEDPWWGIYAVCLGLLPNDPDPRIIRLGNYVQEFGFEHFFDIQRPEASGSAADLIRRLEDWFSITPRRSTMVKLASGLAPNTNIRAGSTLGALPGDRFEAIDAGPNIVVVCSPRNIDDLALLWNLRAAHSDRYVAPIGLLADGFDPADLIRVMSSEQFCRQGIPHKSLYVTSASLPLETLQELVPSEPRYSSIATASPEQLTTLGPAPARHRSEVIMWSAGHATLVPVAPEDRKDLDRLLETNLDHQLLLDLSVVGDEFPAAPDVRLEAINQRFFAGSATVQTGANKSTQKVAWPTRILMARALCSQRGLDLTESAAGRVAMTFLESIDGIAGMNRLAHAPILDVLESMAQRMGTAWAKAHLRAEAPEPGSAVAPTEDDLPEVTFDTFRSALRTTAATRTWLAWAEKAKVVIKGFPITCDRCDASQWLPIGGFAPPIVCRGCGRNIERPFPKESLHFKYRLGEAARRLWEHDAIGHLLVLRYLNSVFEKSLVGSHPGIDISRAGEEQRVGEADCLSLFKNGSTVPCEVKRSFAGVTDAEVAKLDAIVEALDAPWSIVVVAQYHDAMVPAEFTARQVRDGGEPHRVLLTYDHLLEMHPMHGLGGPHPTVWAPLTAEMREGREAGFVRAMEQADAESDWLEWDMLRRHSW